MKISPFLCGWLFVVGCSEGDDGSDARARIDGSLMHQDGSMLRDGSLDAMSMDACALRCGAVCCAANERCLDGTRCVVDRGGPCAADNDCTNDSYCDRGSMRCVSFGPGRDRNAMCTVPLPTGVLRTREQCRWDGPPGAGPWESGVNTSSIPLVADFRMDRAPDARSHPSIVVVGGVGRDNAIFVIDGKTCAHQATLSDYPIGQGSSPAIGDLNGDGELEIVAPVSGGLAAWTWNPMTHRFQVLWHRDYAQVRTGLSSVTLADLNNDQSPEILLGALVFDAEGMLLYSAMDSGDEHCRLYVPPTVVADVDLDNEPEVIFGSGVYRWDNVGRALVREAYSMPTGVVGPVAVADFGDFVGRREDALGRAEIASIQSGVVRITTIGSDTVFGPTALPGGHEGGNLTIADFDGDGKPEFATAGYSFYTVFDPDCIMGGSIRGGRCPSARMDGILWSKDIQENSCAIMGSTVFDFEGDGQAEVVYADECFARIYSGLDGTVLWSRPRSSATWVEGPTVADTDGDLRSEMVLTAGDDYLPSCPATDPYFAGQRCHVDGDCPHASARCVENICRCTSDEQCGDPALTCMAPPAGTPGEGNTCRPTYAPSHGVRVYADVLDRWASSRPIWNQHAYSVTNVSDDGRIPRSSMVRRNWDVPGLNNFRQNVQGAAERGASPDLTARGVRTGEHCTAVNRELELIAEICNRGTLVVTEGSLGFSSADDDGGVREVCRATLRNRLEPGQCQELRCVWRNAPLERSINVTVSADPDLEVGECLEGNNRGTLLARCPDAPQ